MIQWIEMEALFKQTLKKKIPVGFKIKKKMKYFYITFDLFHLISTYWQVVWMNPKKILIGKNQRRFIDDARISIEHTQIDYWNLHIRHIRYEDRGEYTCTVNTSPVQITRVNLMVYGKWL